MLTFPYGVDITNLEVLWVCLGVSGRKWLNYLVKEFDFLHQIKVECVMSAKTISW